MSFTKNKIEKEVEHQLVLSKEDMAEIIRNIDNGVYPEISSNVGETDNEYINIGNGMYLAFRRNLRIDVGVYLSFKIKSILLETCRDEVYSLFSVNRGWDKVG